MFTVLAGFKPGHVSLYTATVLTAAFFFPPSLRSLKLFQVFES